MLMPKRTKHRKLHRGRRQGAAQRGKCRSSAPHDFGRWEVHDRPTADRWRPGMAMTR